MQRVDGMLLVATAAFAGACAVVAPLPAGAVLAAVVFSSSRARTKGTALVVFLLAVVRAHGAIVAHEEARTRVGSEWPARTVVAGTIVSSPALLAGAYRVDVDDGRRRVSLRVETDVDLARGDEVECIAQLAPPYRFWNEHRDPRPVEARRRVLLSGRAEDVVVRSRGRGLGGFVDRARARIRRRIVATFPSSTSGMARALVLGEDDLSETDRDAFKKSGLAHLLAVSGMHLVIVVAGIVAALRAVLVRVPAIAARIEAARVAALFGVPLAWLYADLAGGSGSALRAAWMMTAALLARVLARRSDAQRALALSVIAMTASDPLAPFDASFTLSVVATVGMILLSPRLELSRLPPFLARSLAASAAATLACAPVIARMSPDLPLLGIVANVVAVPVGEAAALPLCLLHAVLSGFPSAERGAAVAASGALAVVRAIATVFAGAGIAAPPPIGGQLASLACAAIVSLVARRPRRIVVAGIAMVLVLEMFARRPPKGVLRVTFLDVGQGDAALVDFPDGALALVDGGGLVGSPVDVGERVLLPVLRSRRRAKIDLVVLTHPHPDHFLGLGAALARVEVGAFWDTGQGEDEGATGAYAELLSTLRRRRVPILRPRDLCGTRAFGGATIDVLAPCPAPSSDRGPNDNSFVLRIRHGRRAFLFAGDAERALEGDLVVQHGPQLRADVLKVGHHGSRTSSSPAFLEAVKPELAVISSGTRNRFGHPHAETLDALARIRARVFRTDREGAITIESDGASLDVQPRSTTPMYGRFL